MKKIPKIKIVSGGQSGVDRAALDAAMECGLPVGGWCPLGRKAEDGRIPDKYPLTENASESYSARTQQNVTDSDGTLILHDGTISGGTALTVEYAKKGSKPCIAIELSAPPSPEELAEWIVIYNIRVLNLAGPRESGSPGIYCRAYDFLCDFFRNITKNR